MSLQLVGRRYEDEKVGVFLNVRFLRLTGEQIIEALEFIMEKTGLPFATYS